MVLNAFRQFQMVYNKHTQLELNVDNVGNLEDHQKTI